MLRADYIPGMVRSMLNLVRWRFTRRCGCDAHIDAAEAVLSADRLTSDVPDPTQRIRPHNEPLLPR